MSILLKKGNLFDTECDIIAHGVNCRGAFGSGVAGQIAKRWPRVREEYFNKTSSLGWSLGQVQWVYPIDEYHLPVVANMATQDGYGYDGKLYVDYSAVEKCLDEVIGTADLWDFSVALPRVGCGLAGGDWKIVFDILLKVYEKYPKVPVEVYSLETNDGD